MNVRTHLLPVLQTAIVATPRAPTRAIVSAVTRRSARHVWTLTNAPQIATTVTPMPTAQIPWAVSHVHAILDTLEMELAVLVCLLKVKQYLILDNVLATKNQIIQKEQQQNKKNIKLLFFHQNV